MTRVLGGVRDASRCMHAVAGISLVFLMLLTLADVVLRAFGHPIVGVYELVGYASAVAIACALPYTAWMRGQVYVDFLLAYLSRKGRLVCHLLTRLLAIALFVVLAWQLVRFGLDLRASGEISPTLELKFYPVVFGVAIACVLHVIVLLCGIVQLFRGEYE